MSPEEQKITDRKAKKAIADKARRAAAKAASTPKPAPVVVKVARKGTPRPNNGGARAGSGAKATERNGASLVVASFRVSAAEKKKVIKLGGAVWLRARINAATVKPGR